MDSGALLPAPPGVSRAKNTIVDKVWCLGTSVGWLLVFASWSTSVVCLFILPAASSMAPGAVASSVVVDYATRALLVGSLVALVFLKRSHPRWSSRRYALCLAAGLATALGAECLLVVPSHDVSGNTTRGARPQAGDGPIDGNGRPVLTFFLAAVMTNAAAHLFFVAALSSPSDCVPPRWAGSAASRQARAHSKLLKSMPPLAGGPLPPPSTVARVPPRWLRGIPFMGLVGFVAVYLKTLVPRDEVEVSRYICLVVCVVVDAVTGWRAAARVGYIVTPRGNAEGSLYAAPHGLHFPERLCHQWLGVVGALLLLASDCVLFLWGGDGGGAAWFGNVSADASVAGASSVLFTTWLYGHWAGLTFLVLSVPVRTCIGRERVETGDPSMMGPALTRRINDMPLSILLIAPHDLDIVELTATWQYLRSRGHDVVCARPASSIGAGVLAPPAHPAYYQARASRLLPVPPLLRLAFEGIVGGDTFRGSLRLADVEPESFHGLIVLGSGPPDGGPAPLTTAECRKIAAFWRLDRPVGAIGSGVATLALVREGPATADAGGEPGRIAMEQGVPADVDDEAFEAAGPGGQEHGRGLRTFGHDGPEESLEHQQQAGTGARDGCSILATRRVACLSPGSRRLWGLVACCCCLGARRCGGQRRGGSVVETLQAALHDPSTQLSFGPSVFLRGGEPDNDDRAFVVRDGNFVSARWRGDAFLFVRTFVKKLEEVARLY